MNYIKTFEIKEYSTDTVIKAGITSDSIIVYWPSFSRALPDSIAPVITLPDSATISPASGKKVAFKNGTIYTVTSAAGTTKKYTLAVSQQSAVPWFYYNSTFIILGDYVSLFGEQFWQDTSQTRVYLVSASTGIAYRTEVFSVPLSGPRFIAPMNLPTNFRCAYQVSSWLINNRHIIALSSFILTFARSPDISGDLLVLDRH